MVQHRTAQDWTGEEVRRLWGWISSRKDMIGTYFSRHKGRALRNLLLSTQHLKGRVLDFGCGPGFLLNRLCRLKGLECEGLDFSPKNAEVTRERLGDNPRFKGATVVDGLPSPYDDQCFDVITCIEVIEHLTEDQFAETIREIHRLLKSGGMALFTTPHDEQLENAQNYCPFCDSQFHRWQHLRAFSASDLRQRLTEAGFEVAFCQGINLERFQPPKKRGLLDMGVAYVAGKLWRGMRDACAWLIDKTTGRKFPGNLRFTTRVTPGPHLIAIVRRA
ncbi:MAG: class I SAM-dependent methyltransferase [Planctomycetes bacterium]|nr:class I SAM-dependent methyltransferase [Planctomycetota bacterium]